MGRTREGERRPTGALSGPVNQKAIPGHSVQHSILYQTVLLISVEGACVCTGVWGKDGMERQLSSMVREWAGRVVEISV